MVKSNNRVVYLGLRLFLPFILFIGGIFVFTSLTISDIDERLGTGGIGLDESSSQSRTSRGIAFKINRAAKISNLTMEDFWKKVNLQEHSIPTMVTEKAQEVKINSGRVNIMNVDTFFREALPPSGVEATHQAVLLLHGANFKSQTWLELNTINLLAAMGHRVIAVDLPGYGETHSTVSGNKGNFLKEFINSLHLSNFIIVSPSMSGGFSIPYMIIHSQEVDGFVPVAPVSTNDIVLEAHKIMTPTLIVYGELDTGLGVISRNHLSHLPHSQVVELPNAKHPAYLDQPKLFHTLLYNFMIQIKKVKN